MEKEYNVGTWLTPSDEYIKDIKQTLVEKGVATELTPNEELSKVIKGISLLQPLIDARGTLGYLFYKEDSKTQVTQKVFDDIMKNLDLSKITSMNNFSATYGAGNSHSLITEIPYFDTSNITFMENCFCSFSQATKIADLDYSNVTTLRCAFSDGASNPKAMLSLTEINLNNTSKCEYFYRAFYGCRELVTIKELDMISAVETVYGTSGMFFNCYGLKNLIVKNVHYDLEVKYSTLTLDSLINTFKECIKGSSTRKLTIGTKNNPTIANVYVKFTDTTQTEIAVGEKGDVVVCEADNNDAMTITEYMALKNWTLA